jgi:hypothetical protein
MMTPTEYRNYIKRLDGATGRWHAQIQAFDIAKLKTDYEVGKRLEHARKTLDQNIQLIRRFMDGQLLNESLGSDIEMQNSVADAADVANGLMWLLPNSEPGESWERIFGEVGKEMTEFDVKIRKHVYLYAEQLQARGEKCSK